MSDSPNGSLASDPITCHWCGADRPSPAYGPSWHVSRRRHRYCSPGHRDQGNRAFRLASASKASSTSRRAPVLAAVGPEVLKHHRGQEFPTIGETYIYRQRCRTVLEFRVEMLGDGKYAVNVVFRSPGGGRSKGVIPINKWIEWTHRNGPRLTAVGGPPITIPMRDQKPIRELNFPDPEPAPESEPAPPVKVEPYAELIAGKNTRIGELKALLALMEETLRQEVSDLEEDPA